MQPDSTGAYFTGSISTYLRYSLSMQPERRGPHVLWALLSTCVLQYCNSAAHGIGHDSFIERFVALLARQQNEGCLGHLDALAAVELLREGYPSVTTV